MRLRLYVTALSSDREDAVSACVLFVVCMQLLPSLLLTNRTTHPICPGPGSCCILALYFFLNTETHTL